VVADNNTDLSNAREQLRQYILQIEDLAALQERNRIARDIHDSLGNALTTLNIQLQTALKLWSLDPAQAQQFLAEAHRLGAIAIQEVRQSVRSIRENELPEQSPEALINALVENFHSSTGILPSTTINLSGRLPIKVVTTIYRIVQESLTNICKYAQATEVQIQLDSTPNHLCLIIQDNGKGFKTSQHRTGFGLQGMGERVTALQGTLNIESKPGKGCKITVELPLEQVDEEEENSEENFGLKTPQRTEKTSQEDFGLKIPSRTEKTSQEDFGSKIPQKAEVEAKPSIALSSEHYKRLESILAHLIGPVASTLLQQVIPSAFSFEELINKLTLHLTEHQQMELREKAIFLLQESTVQPKIISESLPAQQSQDISEGFIHQCERDLAELIGPIASFLVQKAVNSSQGISRSELVDILATKIPEPQIALKFKMRLLS